MAPPLQTIAFYGITIQETANRVLTGMLRYAREAGALEVRDFRVPPTPKLWPRTPPWLGRANGVIAAAGRWLGKSDREAANWLLSGGVPVVSTSGDWTDARIPSFRVNRRELGKLAAEHLQACGCQSYIYVGSAGAPTGSIASRRPFERALARHGRSVSFVDIPPGVYGWQSDSQLIRRDRKLARLLRRLKKPLGVWTLNDYFARGICTLCGDLKLNVPDDVKILGVDDLMVSRAENPSLSTIHTPGEQIGYQALQALHGLLEGRNVPRMTRVPATELVIRESTVQGKPSGNHDLQETLRYIARHACHDLKVPHLAQRVRVSRRTFELNFRALVGHSPHEEIQRVRLERAKALLWESMLSITAVGHLTGFPESTAFCKFFRKETGLSPLEYRAGARK